MLKKSLYVFFIVNVLFCLAESLQNIDFGPIQNLANNVKRLYKNKIQLRNFEFDWQDCGAASNPAHVQFLSVTPDPLRLPGNLNLTFTSTVQRVIQAPIRAVVEMWRKVLFWIEIPCIENVGSCTYTDICTMIAHFQCPPSFAAIGLPCKCPVNMGGYKLPPSLIYIDDSKFAFLANGEYRIRVSLFDSKGGVLCVYAHFSIV